MKIDCTDSLYLAPVQVLQRLPKRSDTARRTGIEPDHDVREPGIGVVPERFGIFRQRSGRRWDEIRSWEAANSIRHVQIDAGAALERSRIATDVSAGGIDRFDERDQLGNICDPGRVPGVGVARGQTKETRAICADH